MQWQQEKRDGNLSLLPQHINEISPMGDIILGFLFTECLKHFLFNKTTLYALFITYCRNNISIHTFWFFMLTITIYQIEINLWL